MQEQHASSGARAHDDADDREAIQQVRDGNTSAFDRIVDRYTPVMYSLAFRYLAGRDDAEDAVQEIFLRAFHALDRFKIERRFYSWLYAIAVNHLRNTRARRQRRGTDADLEFDETLWQSSPEGRINDPQEALSRKEDVRLVHEALQHVPRKYRDALVLHQLEDIPVAEVAEILGVPEGTVKTHLRRGRMALAGYISGIETGAGDDGI